MLSIAVSAFVLRDIARIFVRGNLYQLTIIALIVIGICTIVSLIIAVSVPRIVRYNIALSKLPLRKPFRIVQLSDIHIDNNKTERWLAKVVRQTNAQNPDIIVITGDLIDEDLCKARK